MKYDDTDQPCAGVNSVEDVPVVHQAGRGSNKDKNSGKHFYWKLKASEQLFKFYSQSILLKFEL